MENKIKNVMNKFKNFSGAIEVSRGNKIIFKAAYGYSDKENKIKNSTETKFLTGSITKLFTAVAIMKLYEEGQLDIEDSVIKYLDNFNIEYFIKIKHLLCHKSGIKDFVMARNTVDLYNDISKEELLKLMLESPLSFYPGENVLYSNTGYLMLALIIEKVSNKNYEDYIRENIFKISNMNSSEFYHDNFTNIAKGYIKNKKVALFNETAFYGSGNIISTVDDITKFINTLKSYKIISKETLDLMTEIHGYNNITRYGYGFLLNDKFKDKSIGHSGTYPNGYSTIINNYENNNLTIVILSNDIKPIKLFVPGVANATYIEATIMEEITGMRLSKVEKYI